MFYLQKSKLYDSLLAGGSCNQCHILLKAITLFTKLIYLQKHVSKKRDKIDIF